jgi:ABC-type transport system involved in multi-copper enzyme maturation permease subunit
MLKLNPVYQRELKTGVRSFRTALIILGYNGLLALFGLFAFYVTFEYEHRFGGSVDYASILRIYAIIAATEFCLVLFSVPALTAGAIAGEREKQTLEILLTTKLSPIQIIMGKLASSISMMILLAFSSLPVLALVFSVGGVTLKDFAEFMLLIIVTAIYIGSIGIFFSALFKKTTSATVATYGTLLILVIGTIGAAWVINVIIQMKLDDINIEGTIYQVADIGNWLLLWLINPAVTCFAMIERQIGTGKELNDFLGNFGSVSLYIRNNWFLISTVLQLGISILLLSFSSRLLNPLRKRCYWRKDA